jgi:3-phenylpropionate/trans-cinnamate dioxygenase ferredoxin reductase subunit
MLGLEVSVLEMAPVPLALAVGEEIGRLYAEIHRDEGVSLFLGEAVERFEGNGRAERVVSATGRQIDCDLVVAGVGIAPATELAEEAGLAVDNGIVVDEYCETSAPGIFAAGDVANFHHPLLGHRLRVEHWANAQNQGTAAAKNMLGRREPYAEVPWFWSDQYKLNLQLAGHPAHWDELVFRGEPAARKFSAFYLKDGRLQAVLAVNRFKDISAGRELVRHGVAVAPETLRDEGVDLKSLVPKTE